MRDLVILFVHNIATQAAPVLSSPSPFSRQTTTPEPQSVPSAGAHLRSSDRLVAGLCALLIGPAYLIRSAIVLKPSTLLSLRQALRNRKYQLLFSPKGRRKPGPKGPSRELIEDAIPRGAVRELLSLAWLSTSQSTKTRSFDDTQGFALVSGTLPWVHSFVIVSSRFRMLLAAVVQAASSLTLSFSLKGDAPTCRRLAADFLSRR
jgi:hypothetical protein